MTEIRMNQTMPTEVLRHKLKSFGTFSELEIIAGADEKTGEKGIIFREVKLGERLRRFLFEDKKNIEDGRKKSQDFLKIFAESRPDILKTLGLSIVEKKFWTAGDFRNRLTIKTEIIKRERENGFFQLPQDLQNNVGVTDAKVSEIASDEFIVWTFFDSKSRQNLPEKSEIKRLANALPHISTGEDSTGQKKIAVICEYQPDDSDLRKTYRAALEAASGHLALSPIYDARVQDEGDRLLEYGEDSHSYGLYSDNNLQILIEEIDRAIRENKNLTKVTIACGDSPDEWFLSRVLAQRAIFDKKKNDANKIADTKLASMPPSLKLIVDEMEDKYGVQVKAGNDIFELKKTELSQVGLYRGDPGTIIANTSFLTFSSIDRCASALASSGMRQFQRVRNLIFDPTSGVDKEVQAIQRDSQKRWGLTALELPPCEMPSTKLYAIKESELALITHDSAKKFFTEHLEELEGRVVLEITGNDVLDKAMWEALQDLNSEFQAKQLECILASSDEATIERFLDDIVQPELDIDGDEEDSFDYLEQLKNKRRH